MCTCYQCLFLLLQVIEWFEEYAEEFFQTHTELGDSLDVASALSEEVEQFESSTQVCEGYQVSHRGVKLW